MVEHDFEKFPELTNNQMSLFYFESPHKQIFENFTADVVKVTDGDTIRVRWQERDFDFPIRIAHIQAPELNEGGRESGDWLRDKILNEEVEIIIDRNNRVGKFGRIIGQVFHGGFDVGAESLSTGHSVPFGQDVNPLPPLAKIGGKI